MALIIADSTAGLTRTPEARPEDSVLVESREFTLPQYGPAHVIESSSTVGQIDSDYRYHYGGKDSKSVRDELEAYVKRTYLARSLAAIKHGEGADLSHAFSLQLDVTDATRGNSSLTDSAVAIPMAGPTYLLPSWFSREPDDDPKATPGQIADRKNAQAQRSTEYLLRPFIAEWQYRIILPEGFVARALPEDETVHLGPATLSRSYRAISGTPTVVSATIRFNTVKLRYSAEEALALRKAVLDLSKQNMQLLVFDQPGAKLIAEGKIKDGLTADRVLVAAHPTDAVHHVQFSAALLSAGLGEQHRLKRGEPRPLIQRLGGVLPAWCCAATQQHWRGSRKRL